MANPSQRGLKMIGAWIGPALRDAFRDKLRFDRLTTQDFMEWAIKRYVNFKEPEKVEPNVPPNKAV